MDRKYFYGMMLGEGNLDYELYINTQQLLTAQKPYSDLCNADELQFQLVHQVEELWMKLIAYTLLDIDEQLLEGHTLKVLTLFKRVHSLQYCLTEAVALLETMSPKAYQEIRLQLGNGSGQESPGFRTLLQMPWHLWQSFEKSYLTTKGLTVKDIYHDQYTHCESYVVAEALAEFDELFVKFRFHHFQLVRRSIGTNATSLKGRSSELLRKGLEMSFFPDLWKVRGEMTDAWGGQYGQVRDSLSVS